VIIFITTYGDASIVQARFLKKAIKEHVPRANAAAVFLERVENRPLARMFSDKLELPFPTAMGDEASIAGKGPFSGVDTVPSVVVLDEQGREVWRKVGVAHPEELDRALREAQRGVWGAKAP
jgi:acetyl-CoA carboxylase alpha subunit